METEPRRDSVLKGWNQASNVDWMNEVDQLYPTLFDTMDCSLPGSSLHGILPPWDSPSMGFSLHGILQARVLEWVAIAFSRGSSRPRDRTRVSHIPGKRLTSEPPGKPLTLLQGH